MNNKTLQERTNECIAQGCTTYSKRNDQYIDGIYPTHIIGCKWNNCGYGTYVIGNDGKCYIDMGGLGSNLLYSNNNYSLPHEKEVILAEKLKKLFPFVEVMKFLKTGSAACEMAVRFCRAFTGKKEIWFQGYHGTHDTFICQEVPGAGCIGHEYSRKFESISDISDRLENIPHDKPAAVIIEPVVLDYRESHKNEIIRLYSLCKKMDIPIVFDEIVTGFRFINYSVANDLNLSPDLICFGKALANGYPLSVLAGRKDILNNPTVFCSNTHNGECESLTIALRVLDEISRVKIKEMWDIGQDFVMWFNITSRNIFGDYDHISMRGIPCRFTWEGKEDIIGMMWQDLCKKGYLVGKSMFPKINETKSFYDQFGMHCHATMKDIKEGKVRLEGKLPQPVFKRY